MNETYSKKSADNELIITKNSNNAFRVHLFNANCVDILKIFPDNYIDLTVTSPPYDTLRSYTKENCWSIHIFHQIAKELFRITKKGGVVVWVVGDETIKGSETGTSFKQALYFKAIGFNIHDTMIYKRKGTFHQEKYRYHNIFQYMFVFSKGLPKTANLIADRLNKYDYYRKIRHRQKDGSFREYKCSDNHKVKKYGVRYNIWEYITGYRHSSKDKEAYNHPAIFPEKLANDHIITWTNENDIVLDPMMGSGTTGKMAVLNNRKFIGIEISKEYYKIAEQRILKHFPNGEQTKLFKEPK